MPMTYIGSIYQKYNKDLNEWVTHYLRTHANAVITTEDRTFVSEEQKEFLSSLMGDGSGTEGTAYGELVNKVVEIEELILGTDEDNVINKLKEILDFVSAAEIAEDMTFEQFIASINKLKINNQTIAGTVYSIYAPINSGSAGEVLLSTGSGSAPVWDDGIVVSPAYVVVNRDLVSEGNIIAGDSVLMIKSIESGDIHCDSIFANSSNEQIGDSAEPFRAVFAREFWAGSEPGIEITKMRNVVMKETQPTPADFNRKELIDGLIWIDIGTAPPAPAEWRHSLELEIFRTSDPTAEESYNFFSAATCANKYLIHISDIVEDIEFYPIIVFNSQGKPAAIGVDFYENHDLFPGKDRYHLVYRTTTVSPYDTQVLLKGTTPYICTLEFPTGGEPEAGYFEWLILGSLSIQIPNAYIVSNNIGTVLPNLTHDFISISVNVDWGLA